MAEYRTSQHMLLLAVELTRGRRLTTEWVSQRLEVSRATAKRYLVIIEQGLPVRVQFERTDYGVRRKVLQLAEAAA